MPAASNNGHLTREQIARAPRRYSQVLTMGRAALVAGVAPRTVAAWIDSGQLKGGRLPAGKGNKDRLHRRVLKADLLRFLRERGLPVCSDVRRLLAVTLALPPALDRAVAAACDELQSDYVEHEPCAGLWAISRAAGAGEVRLAVLSAAAGRANVLEALAGLAAEQPAPPCLVLLPEDGDGRGEFAQAPGVRTLLVAHDPAALREECRRLLAGD